MQSPIYIQMKYVAFLLPSLDGWKRTNTYLWNGRCPYCGDSSKSRGRKRGYIYKNKTGNLYFHCHNCGEHVSFSNFLKFFSPHLHKEFKFETFKETRGSNVIQDDSEEEKPKTEFKDWQKKIIRVTDLSRIHPAQVYLKNRQFPKDTLSIFWYTANFREWAHEVLGLVDKDVPDDPRIILVECDKFNNLKLVVARSIYEDNPRRYVTLHVDESYPKIFGLSRLDFTKPIYGVEGALDSLFLPNCFATLDANITAYKSSQIIRSPILIWDNEPRNKDVVRNMKRALEYGDEVVIWPDGMSQKDINDIVKDGIDPLSIINTSRYSGMKGLLRLSKWKKI